MIKGFAQRSVLVVFLVNPASADTNYDLANQLGNLIASQDICRFSVDRDVIQETIVKEVGESDLEFPDVLETSIWSQKQELEAMDDLRRDIHCQQITRAGKKRKLIKVE